MFAPNTNASTLLGRQQLVATHELKREQLPGMPPLTEKIQHFPGDQAHQLLLQHLLRHLALLTHHLLLVLTTEKKNT